MKQKMLYIILADTKTLGTFVEAVCETEDKAIDVAKHYTEEYGFQYRVHEFKYDELTETYFPWRKVWSSIDD